MPPLNAGFKLRDPSGTEFDITGPFRIGRDDECQIKVPNALASRIHASIWVDHGQLLLRDERSRNGTYVNGRRIEPGASHRLYDADRVQIVGVTYVVVTPPPPFEPPKTLQPSAGFVGPAGPPKPASAGGVPRPVIYAALGCAFLLVLALCVAGGFFIATQLAARRSTTVPPSTATAPSPFTLQVLATATPAPPLAPADYAAGSTDLAGALEALNQAQLQLINDLSALPPAGADALDAGLRQVAALAFQVGSAAGELARASAVQGGASDSAGQLSAIYTGLASYGFAQALDAQNLRAQLAAGTLDPGAAVALLADYGARAWNPSVTAGGAPGNPFIALSSDPAGVPAAPPLTDPAAAALAASLGPQAGLQSWAAAAPDTLTRTASLIAARQPLPDPFDPALVARLSTADGQLDADAASQAALQALLRLGATETLPAQGLAPKGQAAPAQQAGHTVAYQAPPAVLLTRDQKPGGGNLPAFPGGTANGLTKNEDEFVNNLMGVDGSNTPGRPESVPVQPASEAVKLYITHIQVLEVQKNTSGFVEAKVTLGFDVGWNAGSLQSPDFSVNCNAEAPVRADSDSGSQHFQTTVILILYPGNANIYCSAGSYSRQLGYASATVLVGEADAATERANRVETEYAAGGVTLTVDAANTTATAAARATQTQAAAQTQAGLETEQAATRTAEAIQTATQAAAQTATAQGESVFSLTGTYSLSQADRGCTFADAPYTSGLVTLNVDFTSGEATLHLSGGGGGVRPGLRCNDSTGDMSWQQDYTADFQGTVNGETGELTLTGKLTGQNNVSWSNCRLNGDPTDCPGGYADPYTFDVQATGTVDRANHTAKGTWFVLPIDLPTSGDWSAGQ